MSATTARPMAHHWLWKRYARTYDCLHRVAGYTEMLDAVVREAGPVAGRTVVEVGCGTGNVLARVVAGRPAGVIGIDASGHMLAGARTKLRQQQEQGLVRLVEADAVAALRDLPDGSVDLLLAVNVLYALPDRKAFWAQAARLLSPTGRVVISNPDRSGFGPAVAQQWREVGLRGFVDPRLLHVMVLNVAIDVIAARGQYAFAPWEGLVSEAQVAGLPSADLRARCFGGPEEGMNTVGVLSRG